MAVHNNILYNKNGIKIEFNHEPYGDTGHPHFAIESGEYIITVTANDNSIAQHVRDEIASIYKAKRPYNLGNLGGDGNSFTLYILDPHPDLGMGDAHLDGTKLKDAANAMAKKLRDREQNLSGPALEKQIQAELERNFGKSPKVTATLRAIMEAIGSRAIGQ